MLQGKDTVYTCSRDSSCQITKSRLKKTTFAFLLSFICTHLSAQTISKESPNSNLPLKIEHAEPLYIDLIRDLGARRGEKEWNVGMGLTDKLNVDEYELLVE